jgi:adenylate cyclase
MDHKQVFVARGRELALLHSLLQHAIQGQGQICFITGEAGAGKTALVTEFVRNALHTDTNLVVAVGQSDSQTGMGDPYLPFREILAQLTGDVEQKLAQGAINEENADRLRKLIGLSGEALLAIGPELIGVFLPVAGFLARAAAYTADKAGWLDKLSKIANRQQKAELPLGHQLEQGHILEQYSNVLRALAKQHPLILVLDDLHWADTASLELLFCIGRRIASERIFVIGTYRPDEVAYGRDGERHPLDKVMAELKRYFGDIFIELGQTTAEEKHTFINTYLDTEPNRLGQPFRAAFYKRTGGNPLFTIELLRNMQERGDLVKDDRGYWVEGRVLDWDSLPTRVEGVIEERVGRLSDEIRQVLTIGSVEGENFTAEVIARVQSQEIRQLVRSLSAELERKHRLISAQGVQELGWGRLSQYRFNHNLFHYYIYNHLDPIERTYLHEEIGQILEDLYREKRDRIALQLAHHFDKAGLADKTRYYMRVAGEQAAQRYANQEAIACYSRALELTPQDEIRQRFDLLMARGKVYHLLGAVSEEQVDLEKLRGLAENFDDPKSQAELAINIANFEISRGDYPAAVASIKTGIRYAQVSENTRIEAKANLLWGITLWNQGNYGHALPTLEKALDLAQQVDARDIEAGCLQHIAVVFWRQGNHDQAQEYYEKALQLFRQLDNRIGESQVVSNLGNIYLSKEEYEKARAMYGKSLRIDRSIGNRRGECGSLGNLGIIFCKQNDYTNAKLYFEQVLQISEELGNRESTARALGNLGGMNAAIGNYQEASRNFDQALNIFREIGNRQAECWILADIGIMLHCMGSNKAALDNNKQALIIAGEIGNKYFRSVALSNLGHTYNGLAQYSKAAQCFERSLEILQHLESEEDTLETQAGLAHTALSQNNLVLARELIDQIVSKLDSVKLSGTEDKMRVLLTCYQVLTAANDPAADQVLDKAFNELQKDVSKINDEEQRRRFLENLPSYREVFSLLNEAKLNVI